ncbi:MAG: potassium channel family protein [Cyanobacteria bacterium]|nr:potassium channel family protein [Cyanobacteriota bacterium]
MFSRLGLGSLVVLSLLAGSSTVNLRGGKKIGFMIFAVITGMLWISAASLNVPPFNTIDFRIFSQASFLLFFATVAGIVLKDIITGEINANRICGAICVYMMIGFCFALIHSMISLKDPLAYAHAAPKAVPQQNLHRLCLQHRYDAFVYFSFCTFSSAGFGDIVPVSRLARSMSWLEAVMGQLPGNSRCAPGKSAHCQGL